MRTTTLLICILLASTIISQSAVKKPVVTKRKNSDGTTTVITTTTQPDGSKTIEEVTEYTVISYLDSSLKGKKRGTKKLPAETKPSKVKQIINSIINGGQLSKPKRVPKGRGPKSTIRPKPKLRLRIVDKKKLKGRIHRRGPLRRGKKASRAAIQRLSFRPFQIGFPRGLLRINKKGNTSGKKIDTCEAEKRQDQSMTWKHRKSLRKMARKLKRRRRRNYFRALKTLKSTKKGRLRRVLKAGSHTKQHLKDMKKLKLSQKLLKRKIRLLKKINRIKRSLRRKRSRLAKVSKKIQKRGRVLTRKSRRARRKARRAKRKARRSRRKARRKTRIARRRKKLRTIARKIGKGVRKVHKKIKHRVCKMGAKRLRRIIRRKEKRLRKFERKYKDNEIKRTQVNMQIAKSQLDLEVLLLNHSKKGTQLKSSIQSKTAQYQREIKRGNEWIKCLRR